MIKTREQAYTILIEDNPDLLDGEDLVLLTKKIRALFREDLGGGKVYEGIGLKEARDMALALIERYANEHSSNE